MTRAQESRNGLTEYDYVALAKCYISREIAQEAGIYRVVSLEGREIVGRRGGGDYAGIVFPYFMPGTGAKPLERLRLDNPPVEAGSKKATYKYLVASNSRNHLYFPPCAATLLKDIAIPVVFVEGEKKTLAMWRAALEAGTDGRPAFLPIGLAGVNGYRSTVEIKPNAKGVRVPHRGVIHDFDLIELKGRKATVLYDSDAEKNYKIKSARKELARELEHREAQAFIAIQPEIPGIKGVDDYLAAKGLNAMFELLHCAGRYDWRAELMLNDAGKIRPGLANAITMLRSAPEWAGVLAWNEFAHKPCALRDAPWGEANPWDDYQTNLLTNWMQRQGLNIHVKDVDIAVDTVARDRTFHPVKDYLDALVWDKVRRIDGWLAVYMGVKQTPFSCAVGAKWMISAVARVYKPGCKADHMLILEGLQGKLKTTTVSVLGEPFCSDDLAEIGTKDASQGTIGVWIIELPELNAMIRADVSKIKAFISRSTDRFRPPFGRRMIEAPRQCVFVGTVNHSEYLQDETGGRRFWPVECHRVDIEALRKDRNQLWAEAVARYRAGDTWWLDDPALVQLAEEEQEARYVHHPWHAKIAGELAAMIADPMRPNEITTAEVLENIIKKPSGQWHRGDEVTIGSLLRKCGWEPLRPNRAGGSRRRIYTPIGDKSNGPDQS